MALVPVEPPETPDPRSGYVVVGRLILPAVVRDRLVLLAAARGLTALALAREVLAAWVMGQPAP